MKTVDIVDSKVGSRQVTAMYFGGVLRWPSSQPTTYEITGAILHFSRGIRIDAGEVGSDYSGNYAWVTGTVVPYIGDVPQTPLTNVMLTPTLTNTNDFVVRDTYYIYGHNLGTTETATMNTTYVDVTYRNSPSFRVGTAVEQVINQKTTTVGTPYIVDGPTTPPYRDAVPNSYVIVLNLSRYTTSANPCPAYGDGAMLVCYGYHDEANYTITYWTEWTPYTYTYTSGATQTIPQETDNDSYPPVQVGQATTVYDDLEDSIVMTFSDGGNWASYDATNDTLTIDNAGTDTYNQPRYVVISVTNGTASDSVTAYQQANVFEGYTAGAITSMTIDGEDTPYTIGGRAATLHVVVTGYRVGNYTSGATEDEAFNGWVLGSNQSWAVVDSSNMTVDVSDSTSAYTRYATITAYDPFFDSIVYRAFDINQEAILVGVQAFGVYNGWVLGTVKVGQASTPVGTYDVTTMVLVNPIENTQDTHVIFTNFEWEWVTPGAPPTTHPMDESGSQNIPAGTTVTLTPYGGTSTTYYGSLLKTPAYPNGTTQTGLRIKSVGTFTLWED